MLIGKDGRADIIVYGPGIAERHADIKISQDGTSVTLVPLDGVVLHNGRSLTEAVEMHDGDRLKSISVAENE
jgi:FHA domain